MTCSFDECGGEVLARGLCVAHYAQRQRALISGLKAERDRLAAENEKLREAMTRLRDAGALMSNLCFNWAQNTERFSDRERQQMDGMRREWDEAVGKARAALARRSDGGSE